MFKTNIINTYKKIVLSKKINEWEKKHKILKDIVISKTK